MADEGSSPGFTFTLHIPPEQSNVAEGDEIESLFPHTPRHDASWFEAEPAAELIEQCLRPGHCGLPEGELREWLHRRLVQVGHAFNERGYSLMAHTWFECGYAVKASAVELISSANMRLKLGQWALVEQLYRQIVRMELSSAQREVRVAEVHRAASLSVHEAHSPSSHPWLMQVAERKLSEVTTLKATERSNRPTVSPDVELQSIVSSPAVVTEIFGDSTDAERMLQLLRSCGFAANRAGDFEAAHLWFDCSFALSSATCDLLSGANMRIKLVPVMPEKPHYSPLSAPQPLSPTVWRLLCRTAETVGTAACAPIRRQVLLLCSPTSMR